MKKRIEKPTHIITARNEINSTSQGAYGKSDLFNLIRCFMKDEYTDFTIKTLTTQYCKACGLPGTTDCTEQSNCLNTPIEAELKHLSSNKKNASHENR